MALPTNDLMALVKKMMEAQMHWETAKSNYASIKRSYTARFTPGTSEYVSAEFRASSDVNLKKAIADCTYYRAETQAYAEYIQAMNLVSWR